MIPLARWAIEPPQTQLVFYTLGRDSLTAPHTDAIKVHPQGVHTHSLYGYVLVPSTDPYLPSPGVLRISS